MRYLPDRTLMASQELFSFIVEISVRGGFKKLIFRPDNLHLLTMFMRSRKLTAIEV